ncbi:MAG TPA: hypothetical protein VFO90_05450, partial [Terrimicrobiaceae bacterium]|nr:hypothetical protein [Terrimicrobiaceae bacterium]
MRYSSALAVPKAADRPTVSRQQYMPRDVETYCLESADFEAMICSDGERSLRLHSDAGEESPDTTRRYALRKRGRAERKFFATE